MDKREFLRTSGLLGLAGVLPVGSAFAGGASEADEAGACVLIPTETAGPFPLDLTANATFFRQDLREGQAGVPLRVRLRVIGFGNCAPMSNLRVNIWHCSAAGLYSGYSQNNNPGQAGLTYLRGYQFTDADGVAEFLTIFPGWYNGRICHIHFQVYVNASYSAISQLTFPIAEKQALYAANSSIYTSGADPMTLASDNVFSDGYQYQMATLTFNADTQEYETFLEVTVQGNRIPTSLEEALNRQQFLVGQNQPNPYSGSTTIPVQLLSGGDVAVDLFDLNGKRVHQHLLQGLGAGEHRITLDLDAAGLPTANYVYQVEVRNAQGVHRTCKMMTAAH